jgi:hypothetical protein
MAPKGEDGRQPASGSAAAAREEIKRGAGVAFSPHVETLSEERATGKSMAAEIGAGGRASIAAAASSNGRTGNGEGGGVAQV